MSATTPFLQTSRAYSITSDSSSIHSEYEGSVSTLDDDLKSEKEYFSRPSSLKTPRLWKRIGRTLGPILWFGLGAVFIFALGFHLGGSVAVYNLENSNGVTELSPSLSDSSASVNSTDTSLNSTDVAINDSDPFYEEEEEEEERALITYVYFETPNARENALFFISHGLHAQADFIFILNGKTDISSYIPRGTKYPGHRKE
ncbi:hypothetical protein TWF281_002413 [Arthrobotrys megalospora]